MNLSEYERLMFEHRTYSRSDFGTFVPPEPSDTVRILHKDDPGYDPPAFAINGGIVLSEGITITREFMDNCTTAEWKAIDKWTEAMPNIVVDEVLKDRLLWVYSAVPRITNMVE